VLREAQRRAKRSSHGIAWRCVRALGLALLAVALTAPFAVAWGVGHASVQDYLGPHRTTFSTDFSGEIRLDLGPFGSAYLPSPAAPVGVHAVVGGVGEMSTAGGFFSNQTLVQYSALYSDPDEVALAIQEGLVRDAAGRALVAELVLLVVVALWLLRRLFIAPVLVTQLSARRVAGVWIAVTAVVVAGIVASPRPAAAPRRPVELDVGERTVALTVDSPLLAGLLTRGVEGVRLLAERQEKALDAYVDQASMNLRAQVAALPAALPGETMLFGYSDLHCNQAMVRLLAELVSYTQPSLVISAGDDTVNGTASERACITREARIGGGIPMVVATGNHDSAITDDQMRGAGLTVLDGRPVTVPGPPPVTLLGDDDPEHNLPFSVDRTLERPESVPQMGERLLAQAQADPVDVLVVHQPTAAGVVLAAPEPPARLVLWGHMHAQAGPSVIRHVDGSWTVGLQAGTAGGVKQPTITSFSTPFSPPLVSADAYFFFRDDATGLITAVQPVHFLPSAEVVIEPRLVTGSVSDLPPETRERLGGSSTPQVTGSVSPAGDGAFVVGASTGASSSSPTG
jgi:hypothetical protein